MRMINYSHRLYIFIGIITLFSLLESFFPYQKRIFKRKQRWFGNLGLIFISNIVLKFIMPMTSLEISKWALQNGLGLINFFNFSQDIITIICSIIFLDFVIYFQHLLTHKIHFFWIFHRVHHSDIDIDATTALRFHPIEIIFSFIYKNIIIVIFGFSPNSIFFFEIILSSMALFNHSNLYLPNKLEQIIRIVFVTPQMHLVHHSINKNERNSNYGFNLSLWDRLFDTYSNSFLGEVKAGILNYRNIDDNRLIKLLIQPFSK